MIRAGRMDVMALPFNQTPFQNAEQWRQMLDWLPDSLWRDLHPRVGHAERRERISAGRSDAAARQGHRHLLMGINADSGGPPFRRPSAFWWKMPDGRRMFVWLGDHYGTAYSYFEPKAGFAAGAAATTALGPPRPGDVLRTDEKALRGCAPCICSRRLAKLEADGYDDPRLILSVYKPMALRQRSAVPAARRFVEAWNKLGLEAGAAVHHGHRGGDWRWSGRWALRIPELEGEWTDWWANGDASGSARSRCQPHCQAETRRRDVARLGSSPQRPDPDIERMLKDLCLFDEHTWGADTSVSQPDAIETIGQYTEKSLLAHRPRGAAEWLLSRRARTKIDPMPEGLYVSEPVA